MTNLTVQQILDFLKRVDTTFPVPLSKKQSLAELAQKFYDKATICAESEHDKIVCIVAGYTEELTDNIAYISVIATLPEARGKGYAKKLIKQFLYICKDKNISAVHLYADKSNVIAIRLYEKLGFVVYSANDEPRPQDMHLIYFLNGEKNK